MGFRVIADHVAARSNLANQFRTFSQVAPNQEESCRRIVLREQIEQLGRDRRIWTIVERNRQLARRIRSTDGLAKELCPRVRAALRGQTAPQAGSLRLVFRSVSRRSTSMSRSIRVSRSPVSSATSSTSAVATASVWCTRSFSRSNVTLLE